MDWLAIFTPKRIVIGLLVIALVSTGWYFKSVLAENKELTRTVKEQTDTIAERDATIKFDKDVQVAMQNRITALQAIRDQREERVEVVKENSNTFVQKQNKKAAEIKQKTPELLDEHYTSEYNTILDCIGKVTQGKKDEC